MAVILNGLVANKQCQTWYNQVT